MKSESIATTVTTDAEGNITGWKNAFGEWELNKGITKKVGEPTIQPRSMNVVPR